MHTSIVLRALGSGPEGIAVRSPAHIDCPRVAGARYKRKGNQTDFHCYPPPLILGYQDFKRWVATWRFLMRRRSPSPADIARAGRPGGVLSLSVVGALLAVH